MSKFTIYINLNFHLLKSFISSKDSSPAKVVQRSQQGFFVHMFTVLILRELHEKKYDKRIPSQIV